MGCEPRFGGGARVGEVQKFGIGASAIENAHLSGLQTFDHGERQR